MHFTRETLKKRLDEGSIAEKQLWRRRWIQHNRNTLASVFKLIENTVHTINPTLSIGFMTGDRMIEGYDFDYWAQILAGKNHGLLGKVTDVDDSTINVLLKISSSGNDLLLPAAKDLILSVDVKNRRLDVSIPDGLLDI